MKELTIRKMDRNDLEPLVGLLSDSEVMRFLEPPFSREKTEQFLEQAGLSPVPLIYAVDDESGFVGYVIYHDYDKASVEIGWVLSPEVWGKGYASELTCRLLERAAAGHKKAVIECLPEQEATRLIALKHGFRLTGEQDGLLIYTREADVNFTFENNGLTVKARFSRENVDGILLPLIRRLTELQKEKNRRVLVLLAAPPGAGKSTLAAFLRELSLTMPELCPMTVIGMDGFHRRQEYLLSHTVERDGETIPMVKIKGAPVTFDLDLLRGAVARVAAGESCGWPVYDRLLHDPRDDALRVEGDLVLLEGNYLLLDEDGWRDLRQYADYTVKITANPDFLRERLIARHIASGKSPEDAAAFVDGSDLPNARLCLDHSLDSDLTLALRCDGTFAAG